MSEVPEVHEVPPYRIHPSRATEVHTLLLLPMNQSAFHGTCPQIAELTTPVVAGIKSCMPYM